jgi:tetratricopeptide (TPR) repeat protein
MSNPLSGTLPQPSGRYDAIRALLRAGKNDEAIVQLCAITVTHPQDLVAKELLFDAFFQKRDWEPALALAEELNRSRPDNSRLEKARIATLTNLKRYDETITLASRYLERHGDDLTILDTLKVANFYTGKTREAIRYGQRALDLRDAEACANPPPFSLKEPGGPPSGKKVISFSLWGTKLFYSYGAMINLVLSREIYPGWTCRYYVDATAPPACVAFLRENGAELRNMEEEYPGVGLFQRFLVVNDATVGYFLVRDCDARVSAAEADAVQQWIESDYPFHVMRDHVMHNELMMGGTWDGRTDCGIDIAELMRRYFKFGPTAKYGHDQRMLGLMLWPLVRSRCLVHDRHYRLPGVHTLPLSARKGHFGAGHQNLAAVLAEVDRLGIPRLP